MIFLTLGTQLPFDRLVEAVDEVAATLEEPVFGQIGKARYLPSNFEYVESLPPTSFSEKFKNARIVIGHAGIGTILSGFNAEKPLVLMARRASLGEHRNDHQLATVEQVRKLSGVYIAESATDIDRLLKLSELPPMQKQNSPARESLIARIRAEIFG